VVLLKLSKISMSDYVKRCLLHVPVGLAIAWITMLGNIYIPAVVVGYFLFRGFLAYELNEDYRIKDYAYPDIAGSLWGMFTYMVYWAISHR